MIGDIDAIEDRLDCDVCIVGSGVIGLALMREFEGSGLSVVVLESGGEAREEAIDDSQASIVHGSHFHGATEGRARQLGGTSNIWGGQALPMDAIDFTRRDWVPDSGWPIALDVLDPFYHRAARFLDIDDRDFDRDVFTRFGIERPSWLPSSALRFHVSKWAPVPRLIDLYRRDIERSSVIRLVLHANLTDIALSTTGDHVEWVTARNLEGRRIDVHARRFVLATGAIETARTLLAASRRNGRPIGDGHALIGRYLMDHPSGAIGELRPADEAQAQRLFNLFYIGRRKYSARLSLAESAQRDERLLNISCGFNFSAPPNGAIEVLRRGLAAMRARSPRRMAESGLQAVAALPSMAQWAWQRAVRHRAVYPGASINLVVNCEQAPSPDNRVALSAESDAFGIPRSDISWVPGAAAEAAARRFAHLLRQCFADGRAGEVILMPWINDPSEPTTLQDAFHPMGTTRMSDSSRTGVVNSECRMFGVSNLWVAGTAPFPTAGHSNPTFTAIALAIRLADHLKTRKD